MSNRTVHHQVRDLIMHTIRTLSFASLLIAMFISQQLYSQTPGQEIRWLQVGTLQTWISNLGSEIETGRTGQAAEQMDGMVYPAQYRFQNNQAAKSLWIATSNYADRNLGITVPARVVAVGTRAANPLTELIPTSMKMYGRYPSPNVVVDGTTASENASADEVDVIDETLKSDRMIVTVLNSTVGITMTRKVMAFSQQNHDNYFITEYIFKNTGIIDKTGTVESPRKTLTGVYFFWQYRYAFGEEGYRNGAGTPSNNIGWGRNAVHQVIGKDTTAPGFDLRAHYSWYGKHSQAPRNNIGAPAYWTDGHLTAPQFVGVVTLHADRSPTDKSDDRSQPRTTTYWGADSKPDSPQDHDPKNPDLMQKKYDAMKSGHSPQTHADLVGSGNADQAGSNPGGYQQGEGYGPYTLAPGDSIRIVVAEGAASLSREQCYEIGRKWLNREVPYTMPNGTTTSNEDDYKNAWVFTGVDSLLQTFRRAMKNFKSNYAIPTPPPPPSTFEVQGGGDRIQMTWTNDAETFPGFDGYEIYRAIDKPDTFYTKIFSCNKASVVNSFDDVSAVRGRDYYYYIVTKDNGSTNDVQAGVPLVSSKYFTRTNQPTQLKRPAKRQLDSIRVVPNPFDTRAAMLQFGETVDRITFYGLPPVCTIRIYTERGDLIKTLEHSNGTGDELWNSTTEYRQIVVSGVYIAVFTTPDGRSAIRKFIVIR